MEHCILASLKLVLETLQSCFPWRSDREKVLQKPRVLSHLFILLEATTQVGLMQVSLREEYKVTFQRSKVKKMQLWHPPTINNWKFISSLRHRQDSKQLFCSLHKDWLALLAEMPIQCNYIFHLEFMDTFNRYVRKSNSYVPKAEHYMLHESGFDTLHQGTLQKTEHEIMGCWWLKHIGIFKAQKVLDMLAVNWKMCQPFLFQTHTLCCNLQST